MRLQSVIVGIEHLKLKNKTLCGLPLPKLERWKRNDAKCFKCEANLREMRVRNSVDAPLPWLELTEPKSFGTKSKPMPKQATTSIPDHVYEALYQKACAQGTTVYTYLKNLVLADLGISTDKTEIAKTKVEMIIAAIPTDVNRITKDEIRTLLTFKVTNYDISAAMSKAGFGEDKDGSYIRLVGRTFGAKKCQFSLVEPERICEKGTKGCKVRHSALPSTSDDPKTTVQ